MFWQHIFIPVLPQHLMEYLTAPMPFLIGVPQPLFARTNASELGDVVVLHAESRAWFRPAQAVGPGGRAFHGAAVLGRRMFVFGGRTGRRKHRDVWVLDTDSWQWSALATTCEWAL